MSKKIFLILFGLFVFLLLPNFVEAACGINCCYRSDVGVDYHCAWGEPATGGTEKLGIIESVEQGSFTLGQCGIISSCFDSEGKCKNDKFPTADNGQVCVARDGCWGIFGCSQFTKTGVWDASKSQCVTCSGKFEDRILGNTTEIVAHCGNQEGNVGDSKCESACGADPECDEKDPGDSCSGGVCSDSCQCEMLSCEDACQGAGYDRGMCMGGDESCAEHFPFSGHGHCYHNCHKIIGTDCDSCLCYDDDPNEPSCGYYSSGSTCYYNGSTSCGSGGWTSCSYSNCNLGNCCNCTSGGCNRNDSWCASNNCRVNCTCEIEYKPDLHISDIWIDGAGGQVEYTIQNLGGGDAGTSYSAFYVEDGSVTSCVDPILGYQGYDTVDSVGANSSHDETVTSWTCTPGQTYTITLYADGWNDDLSVWNIIDESDETKASNCRYESLTCPAGPAGTLTCGTETQTTIPLNYTFTNGTDIRIYRDGVHVANLSGEPNSSGTWTDTGRPAGTSYTYTLRNGASNILATRVCATAEPADNPPWGTLTANPITVNVGETITLKIIGSDDIGVDSVGAYYSGAWHWQACSGTSCTKYWYISETTAGIYTYSGYVFDSTSQGAYTNNVSVTVTDVAEPDLIITDISTSGSTISYNIKNQGTASAGASYSYLYVDGSYKTNDYAGSLSAGSSRNESFSYTWTCSGTSDTIRVCADGGGAVSESDEGNNYREETWDCEVCECSSGPCCSDGCNYDDSSVKCAEDVTTEYYCRDGTDCGQDVYVHHQDRYCSESSANCTGNLVWDTEVVYDNCAGTYTCTDGDSSCTYDYCGCVAYCGDGSCDCGETNATCPGDCEAAINPPLVETLPINDPEHPGTVGTDSATIWGKLIDGGGAEACLLWFEYGTNPSSYDYSTPKQTVDCSTVISSSPYYFPDNISGLTPDTTYYFEAFAKNGGSSGPVCVANGELCSADGDCCSGYCVDGVCCNSDCLGDCQACNLAGSEGTCTTRSADDNTECGGCERCDGSNTTCQYVASGQEGKNCTAVCKKCNGSGSCVNVADNTQDTAGSNLCKQTCKKCSGGSCVNQGNEDLFSQCGTSECGTGLCKSGQGKCDWYASGERNCSACRTCTGATSPSCANITNNTQDTEGSNLCNGTCQACQSGSCGAANAGTDPGNDCSTANCGTGNCRGGTAECGWYTSGDRVCPACKTCSGAISIACVNYPTNYRKDTTAPNICTGTNYCCVNGGCGKPKVEAIIPVDCKIWCTLHPEEPTDASIALAECAALCSEQGYHGATGVAGDIWMRGWYEPYCEGSGFYTIYSGGGMSWCLDECNCWRCP